MEIEDSKFDLYSLLMMECVDDLEDIIKEVLRMPNLYANNNHDEITRKHELPFILYSRSFSTNIKDFSFYFWK